MEAAAFHSRRSTALLQVGQLRLDQLRAEPGPLELALDVALGVGVGVARLGAGVEPDVGEEVAGSRLRPPMARGAMVGEMPLSEPRSQGWNGTSATACR